MSAEAAKSGGGLTEYIQHHLTHGTTLVGGSNFHWDTWAVSLGLGLIFVLWFTDTPEEHPRTNEAERELIASGRGAAQLHEGVPWRRIFGSRLLHGSLFGRSGFFGRCRLGGFGRSLGALLDRHDFGLVLRECTRGDGRRGEHVLQQWIRLRRHKRRRAG